MTEDHILVQRADQLVGRPGLESVQAIGEIRGLHPLRSARLVELTTEQVHPGELLVCAVGDVTSWRLDALIRRAVDAEAAGILLPCTKSGPSAASKLLAERLRLPLLTAPGQQLLDVVSTVLNLISTAEVDQASSLLRCAHLWRDGKREPDGVLADIDTELGGQAHLGDQQQANRWAPALRTDLHLAQTFSTEMGELIVAYPVASPARQWLMIRLDDPPPVLVDKASRLARFAVLYLRGWFLSRRWELERDQDKQALLLADLLAEHGHLTAATRRRTAEMGWRLDGWHVGLHLVSRQQPSTEGHEQVVTALRKANVSSAVVPHEAGWTGWVTTDEAPQPDSQHRLLNRLGNCVHALGEGHPLRIGVGSARTGPQGLTRSVTEAREIAHGIDTRYGGVASTDALGIHRLIGGLLGSPTAQVFAESALAPIAGDASLLDTLAAYLDNAGSITATATQVGVHRNTINSRLGRIQRSLDVDLADSDVRLTFQLACRALNVDATA